MDRQVIPSFTFLILCFGVTVSKELNGVKGWGMFNDLEERVIFVS